MAAVVAAVVSGDHEQGILGDAGLHAGVVDALCVGVADVDLVEVILGSVAVAMAGAVHGVELDEQEGGLLLLHVRADALAERLVVPRLLGDADAVLNEAVVDGVPVGEGAQGSLGHGLADHAEYGGMLVGGQGSSGASQLVVVQTVDAAGNAREHRAPALGGIRGDGGQTHIGTGTLSHHAADHGGGGVAVEVSCAVDADEDDVLVRVHGKVSLQRIV